MKRRLSNDAVSKEAILDYRIRTVVDFDPAVTPHPTNRDVVENAIANLEYYLDGIRNEGYSITLVDSDVGEGRTI